MKKLTLIGISLFMFFFSNNVIANYEKVFYDFKIKSITGEIIDLNDYKNKVVLLVNTASYCGFTRQYDELTGAHGSGRWKARTTMGPQNS